MIAAPRQPADPEDMGTAAADAQRTAELARRAREGDTAAFEALYRLHAGRTYALCLRLCGDPTWAETLAQDAFVRAWRKLPTFEGRSAFGTWLHRLTVNLVIEELRAEARRNGRVFAIEDLTSVDVARPDASPGTALDLERAIAALPAGARLIFVLHDVQGYRHEEIARMTGLSAGTSKSQLHRARRLLREALA